MGLVFHLIGEVSSFHPTTYSIFLLSILVFFSSASWSWGLSIPNAIERYFITSWVIGYSGQWKKGGFLIEKGDMYW